MRTENVQQWTIPNTDCTDGENSVSVSCTKNVQKFSLSLLYMHKLPCKYIIHIISPYSIYISEIYS